MAHNNDDRDIRRKTHLDSAIQRANIFFGQLEKEDREGELFNCSSSGNQKHGQFLRQITQDDFLITATDKQTGMKIRMVGRTRKADIRQ